MKLKEIKQQLAQLHEQYENGEALSMAAMAELKTVLQDKKIACKYNLRHRVAFVKREKTEKKLKKVKACLKALKSLEEAILASS